MNVLVTGSEGFVGKNLVATLENIRSGKDKTRSELQIDEIFKFDISSDEKDLAVYCRNTDFVFHLAGVNRPLRDEEFMNGNRDFTEKLLNTLRAVGNRCPVCLSSSIQADMDNPYGRSKLEAEELVKKYGDDTGVRTVIYRFPNLFGKWSRHNYNTVIATFCYSVARGERIEISDPEKVLRLAYIDDVVDELLNSLTGREHHAGDYCDVPVTHSAKLGEIAGLIYSFRESRETQTVPALSDGLTRKLYATYLSFLPEDGFAYDLAMKTDERGSFTEFIKSDGCGQMSVNVIKPGVIKGQHWHHTKNEKFLVVHGEGVVRFREIHSSEIIEYPVRGDKLRVVDIPCGYTHNIENLGKEDMVVLMWASECFDPDKPDTYYLEV